MRDMFNIIYRDTWQFIGGAQRYAYDNEQITNAFLGGRGMIVRHPDVKQGGGIVTNQQIPFAGIATMSGSIVGQPLYVPESFEIQTPIS